MILFFISLLAGALTALAPCTIALLPIIVGGALSGGSSLKRAGVVAASLGISVILFTLALKVSTVFINVPQSFWQSLSGIIVIFLGFAMIFPILWEKIPGLGKMNRGANRLITVGYQKHTFFGDILVGAALGPVFSSCSPTYFLILATVLPRSFAAGFIYLIAYTLGLCGLLFVITLAGQKLLEKLGVASDPRGLLKRGIGIFFVLVGVAIFFGYDKTFESALTDSGYFDETKIEQRLLSGSTVHPAGIQANSVASSSTGISSTATSASQILVGAAQTEFPTLAQKAEKYEKAPELVRPDGYINTDGQTITLGQYLGKKVVLVDFWDYSCINCQRTLPYVNAWYKKYKEQGLAIVGIHTPEFAFEHLQPNVQAAVTRFGIQYPVVLDNSYQTWSAFQNKYWPREYLIDIDGYIVHDHAGEGEYAETEQAIQRALAERAARLGIRLVATSTVNTPIADLSMIRSPEIYFGSGRNEYLGNGTPGISGMQSFMLPGIPRMNMLYLGGSWNLKPEYAETGAGGAVLFEYSARDVHMVATNPGAAATIKVLRDGKPLGSFAGADVDLHTSEAVINADRLYTLIHDPTAGIHTITIEVEEGTLDAYTFTFG